MTSGGLSHITSFMIKPQSQPSNRAWWLAVQLLLSTPVLLPVLLPDSAAAAGVTQDQDKSALPVRGIHLSAPSKNDLSTALSFIGEVLSKEGVNTLILEFNYSYNFQSRPEFADSSALGRDEVQQIVRVCREKGIELIPQINCLGHQSWAKRTDRLLTKHPEFDETPGKYPDNKDIYCRSYCPLHPEVHKVLFELIDELAKACEAKSFHVGMDEVFILADRDCPRCKDKTTAEMFATEVKMLQAHLKAINCRMWMWGDRFLDGKSTRLGKWEASENGTQSAIDLVPKDIVICDWHYDAAPETPQIFASKGFDVVACPWRKQDVALSELRQIKTIRSGSDAAAAKRALGVVQTTWCGFSAFVKACDAQSSGAAPSKGSAFESAACFSKLFAAMRETP